MPFCCNKHRQITHSILIRALEMNMSIVSPTIFKIFNMQLLQFLNKHSTSFVTVPGGQHSWLYHYFGRYILYKLLSSTIMRRAYFTLLACKPAADMQLVWPHQPVLASEQRIPKVFLHEKFSCILAHEIFCMRLSPLHVLLILHALLQPKRHHQT